MIPIGAKITGNKGKRRGNERREKRLATVFTSLYWGFER